MFAITIPAPGGPEVLTWAEVPDPVPGPGELVIAVVASAVNRADVMQRMGHYAPPSGAPEYPGLECSGRICALGDDVSGWQVGDEVCALLAGGGYAEKVRVPAAQVLPAPAGVDLVTAAGLPEVCCTVWSNVFMHAGLSAGEVFLVHGGSSGIGTMAIQLAARAGARVCVTAGSAVKLAACRELGAEVTVNYREEDFVAAIRTATDGHGADVVLDNMGASYLARNLDVLATDGRLVIIGLQGGAKAELDIGAQLRKRASVSATSLRSRPVDGPMGKGEIVGQVRREVWPAIAAGEVRAVIDQVLPMREAARAHELLEASGHIGKILLTTDA